ncbi:MAG: hypothetical protein C4K60_11350 [Ideonella sp. MAG2]|nr:MAG: hypothetical protein C4K60_11350 [Ideonella sp. MAG2]
MNPLCGGRGSPVPNASCRVDMAINRVMSRPEETRVLEEGQPPCFAAGTLVHTKEGLKPIEEIKVGDWVLSYPDDQTTPDKFREESEYFYKQVTQVFVTDDKPLCRLIVDNLATGDREEFLVTPEHPVYCQGRGWVPVSKIRACDCVEQFQFRHLMVSRCYQNVARGRVYNFEVEDFHTYYVGKEGVWVHNTCGPEINKFELSKLDTLKQTDRA